MNRRGKRITLGVVAVGLTMVLGLAVAYRKPILEHVEAWHFQLTRKTETVEPDPLYAGASKFVPHSGSFSLYLAQGDLLRLLADCAEVPVVLEAKQPPGYQKLRRGYITAEVALREFRDQGWHIVAQRLPRRAYIVVRAGHRPSRPRPPDRVVGLRGAIVIPSQDE